MPGHLQSLLLVRGRPALGGGGGGEEGTGLPLSAFVWQRPVEISSVFPSPGGIEQYFFKPFLYDPLEVEKRELAFARKVVMWLTASWCRQDAPRRPCVRLQQHRQPYSTLCLCLLVSTEKQSPPQAPGSTAFGSRTASASL